MFSRGGSYEKHRLTVVHMPTAYNIMARLVAMLLVNEKASVPRRLFIPALQ
jgi:hypothetical protein